MPLSQAPLISSTQRKPDSAPSPCCMKRFYVLHQHALTVGHCTQVALLH